MEEKVDGRKTRWERATSEQRAEHGRRVAEGKARVKATLTEDL